MKVVSDAVPAMDADRLYKREDDMRTDKEATIPENRPDLQSPTKSEALMSAAPEEIAGYVADILMPLYELTRDNNMEFLSYLLEMAREEAMICSMAGRN